MAEMTTPTPEPARAEPVDGDAALKAAVDAYDVARCQLNESWHGGRCEPSSEAAKANISPMIAAAIRAYVTAPASDAGLAEVERLLDGVCHANQNVGAEETAGTIKDLCRAKDQAREARADIATAFAAQTATIAALRADNDRLRADAAGRGEGVESPGLQKAEDIADHWHQRFLTLRSEASAGNLTRRRNLTERAEGAKQVLDEIRAERARIAAAPAPATDGTGGWSDGA